MVGTRPRAVTTGASIDRSGFPPWAFVSGSARLVPQGESLALPYAVQGLAPKGLEEGLAASWGPSVVRCAVIVILKCLTQAATTVG